MSKCESDKCKANCCSYISVHIDAPRTKVDFDELEWFVFHENTIVYKDHENDWIVEVMTPCGNLKDNRCAVYEDRPDVCRGYDPENCTHNSEQPPTKILLKTREDVRKLAAKRFKRKAKKKVVVKKTVETKTAADKTPTKKVAEKKTAKTKKKTLAAGRRKSDME